jgi:hypothetical protein
MVAACLREDVKHAKMGEAERDCGRFSARRLLFDKD